MTKVDTKIVNFDFYTDLETKAVHLLTL